MGITLDFAFDRTSSEPVDSSLVLSKAEMLAVNDNMMPDKYFAVCKDDGGFYIYDKSATPSAETGKFTELKGGGGEEGKTYTMDWDESTHELTLTDGTTPQNLELTGLQSELTAGENISIVEDPYTGTAVISSTGGGSTYTAGNGIDITNDVISADIKTINSSAITGSGNLTTGKVISDYQTNSTSIYEGADSSVQISKVNNDTLRVQGWGLDSRGQSQTLYDINLPSKTSVQEALVSGSNIKTINNESLLGSGNINTTVVGSDWGVAKTGSVSVSNIGASVNISDLNLSSVNDYQVSIISTENYSNFYVVKGTNSFTIYAAGTSNAVYTVFAKGYGGAPAGGLTDQVLAKRSNATGDFEWVDPGTVADVDQTYDATSSKAQSGTAVAGAISTKADTTYVDTADANLQTQIDALGEPFRVKQWASNTIDVSIPTCTTDVTNTNIPKMVFAIDDVEGADYQIVGMIAYEVFDAASGGGRINCWPVCQFTGNQQKELSVRWMCGGTTPKTAKRINAWVLLKHR